MLRVLLFTALYSLGLSRLAVELGSLTLSESLPYLFVHALILYFSLKKV